MLFLFATVVAAAESPNLESTIVQNGAPIAIDRCVVTLRSVVGDGSNNLLLEDVGFSNVSQRTVTQVRIEFDIVDVAGVTTRKVTSEKLGSLAPGAAINDVTATTPQSEYTRQNIGTVPKGAKVLCRVQAVRFDDGSTWHEGDGPAGNAVFYTPVPGPTPTTQWQWPYDTPMPH